MTRQAVTKIKHYPLLTAMVLSLIVSAIVLAYRQPLNADGMIYLKTASLLLHKGFRYALEYYHWPFYSILLAVLSKVFHLSLITTIYLTNAVLDAIAVVAFVLLSRELGGDLLTQWISAGVLLTFPYFTHLRDHVVRGHGYYAFVLFAIVLLIRYIRQPNLRYALLWGLAMVIAVLFRIEGLVLLALLPLAIVFKPQSSLVSKFKVLLGAYLIPLCCLALVILASIQHASGINAKIDQLTHMLSSIAPLDTIIYRYQQVTQFLVKIIGQPVQHDVIAILIFGLLGLLIYKLIHVFTLFYSVLAIYAVKRRLLPADWAAKTVLLTAIIANVLIVGFFVSQAFFISGRYWGLMSLLLLTLVPFALIDIYQRFKTKLWVLVLVSILLFLTIMSALGHFGPSKSYLVAAGKWMEQHTPRSSVVYTNNPQLLFYMHREGSHYPQDYVNGNRDLPKILQQNLAIFDYLVIDLRHDDHKSAQQLSHIQLHLIKCFHNRRGDRMLIYKLLHKNGRN